MRQNAGAIDEYLALAAEADRIAARSGDRAAHAAVGPDHFYALYYQGAVGRGLVGCAGRPRTERRRRESWTPRWSGYSSYVVSYIIPALTLIEMGRIREAEACARRGLELAKEHGPEETRSWAYDVQVCASPTRGATAVRAQ